MEHLAKISIVPMDYEERKQRVIEAIITYLNLNLNYDSVSDERWHSPFSEERQIKVRKDAEKIAEISLNYYKLNL